MLASTSPAMRHSGPNVLPRTAPASSTRMPLSGPFIARSLLRLALATIHPRPDLAIVVLQVARGRERAQVHPLGEHAVADETVVALVRVALPDAGLDLARDG